MAATAWLQLELRRIACLYNGGFVAGRAALALLRDAAAAAESALTQQTGGW
jgi:hypothetical protein